MIECEICLEEYQEGHLDLHRETCVVRLAFRCSICQEDYTSREALWNHLDLHEIVHDSKEVHSQEVKAKYKLHQCTKCNDQRGYSESSYQIHVRDFHGNVQAEDQTEALGFNTLLEEAVPNNVEFLVDEKMNEPLEEHSNDANEGLDNRLVDDSCVNQDIHVENNTTGHSKLSTSTSTSSSISKSKPKNAKSECPQCLRKFYRIGPHMATCGRTKYECELCGKKFHLMSRLEGHKENMHFIGRLAANSNIEDANHVEGHDLGEMIDTSQKMPSCIDCAITFDSVNELRQHKLTCPTHAKEPDSSYLTKIKMGKTKLHNLDRQLSNGTPGTSSATPLDELFRYCWSNAEQCTVVQTKRGGLKLVYQGFQFYKDKEADERTYWECVRRKDKNPARKCHARARTIRKGCQYRVESHGKHTHRPDGSAALVEEPHGIQSKHDSPEATGLANGINVKEEHIENDQEIIPKGQEKTDSSVCPFKCFICDLSFRNIHALRYHRVVIHQEPQHECFICQRKFYFRRDKILHQKRCSSNRCYKCDIKFPKRSQLHKHNIAKHSRDSKSKDMKAAGAGTIRKGIKVKAENITPEPSECSNEPLVHQKEEGTNDQEFMSLPNNNTHQKEAENVFPCSICGRIYVDSRSAWYHKLVSHTEPQLKCSLCPKSFHLPYILSRHLKVCSKRSARRRNQNLRKPSRDNVSVNVAVSKGPENPNEVKEEHPEHEEKTTTDHHAWVEQPGTSVGKNSEPHDSQLKHASEEHQGNEQEINNKHQEETESSEFRCFICDMCFGNKHALKYHTIVNHQEPQHSCSVCQRKFHFPRARKLHEERCAENRCHKCDIKFYNRSQLDKHNLAKHAQDGKGTKVNDSNDSPVPEKPGAKEYPCTICGRIFKGSNHAWRHKIISHTEPQLKCSFCRKRFHLTYQLRRHVQACSSMRCHECGINFPSRAMLSHHNISKHPQDSETMNDEAEGLENAIQIEGLHPEGEEYYDRAEQRGRSNETILLSYDNEPITVEAEGLEYTINTKEECPEDGKGITTHHLGSSCESTSLTCPSRTNEHEDYQFGSAEISLGSDVMEWQTIKQAVPEDENIEIQLDVKVEDAVLQDQQYPVANKDPGSSFVTIPYSHDGVSKNEEATDAGTFGKKIKVESGVDALKSPKCRNEPKVRQKAPKKSYPCSVCGRTFAKTSVLWSHKVAMHTEPRLKCSFCQKAFHFPDKLRRHVELSCSKMRCHECGIMFTSRGLLESHNMSKHSRDNESTNANAQGIETGHQDSVGRPGSPIATTSVQRNQRKSTPRHEVEQKTRQEHGASGENSEYQIIEPEEADAHITTIHGKMMRWITRNQIDVTFEKEDVCIVGFYRANVKCWHCAKPVVVNRFKSNNGALYWNIYSFTRHISTHRTGGS